MAAANRFSFDELQSAAVRMYFEGRYRVVVPRRGVEEFSAGVDVDLGGSAWNLLILFRQRFNSLDFLQCAGDRIKAKRCDRNFHFIDDIGEPAVGMQREVSRPAAGRTNAGAVLFESALFSV